jgi:ADP-heptose:LPS heptosyltransferase
MYHDLLKSLCESCECSLPEIYVSSENLNKAAEIIGEKNKKTILIHPGVSKMSIRKNIIKFWDTKNWVDLVIKLAQTGKYKLILAGGPDDEVAIRKIKEELSKIEIDKSDIIDTFGKTKNISQLAGLIKLSDAIVCVDSAPMHIGVGTGTDVIAIFGPTDEKKLVPQDLDRIKVIKNNKINCRPCLWDKRQVSCDLADCLKIEVEDVFQAVESTFIKAL